MGDCKDCSLEKRIERMENKIENLSEKITTTDAQYGFIVQAIGELKGQVNSILSVPTKRWEIIVAVILTAVITAMADYIFKK